MVVWTEKEGLHSPIMLRLVMINSGRTMIERGISINFFRTSATPMVIALFLPNTRIMDMFQANADTSSEKNILERATVSPKLNVSFL